LDIRLDVYWIPEGHHLERAHVGEHDRGEFAFFWISAHGGKVALNWILASCSGLGRFPQESWPLGSGGNILWMFLVRKLVSNI